MHKQILFLKFQNNLHYLITEENGISKVNNFPSGQSNKALSANAVTTDVFVIQSSFPTIQRYECNKRQFFSTDNTATR